MNISGRFISDVWTLLLRHLYESGDRVTPRGRPCRELRGLRLDLTDACNNIINNAQRRLSYRFMVAEWLWMWFGRNDVATISRYNLNIASFSDDGVIFNGAYGVPIVRHWPRVLQTLRDDPDSRQAVLPIYSAPTGPTRDVPCTIALQFLVRDDHLETIATMRSSDAWLGLPYDVFNFTMLGNVLAAQLGVGLGRFTLFIGSSHLYESDVPRAVGVFGSLDVSTIRSPYVSTIRSPYLNSTPPSWLESTLTQGSLPLETREPWRSYARVLLARDQREAREWLLKLA